MSDHQIRQIARWLAKANAAVAFTGAGISTESGLPDFRSPGGIWATSQPVMYDEFLTSAAARREYWRQKAVSHHEFEAAAPNVGHKLLAAWENAGRLRAIITQNIDELHQQAGARKVLELHGTARQIGCLQCSARFAAAPLVAAFEAAGAPPVCPTCGGMLKHATISFGQSLDQAVIEEAVTLSHAADLFFALGSSLVVSPANMLPAIAKQTGGRLVIINREPTALDDDTDVVLHASIGETLRAIDAAVTAII